MLEPFMQCPAVAFGKPVARFGLATRLSGGLTPDDVLHALDQGVSFLNWPGFAEGETGPDAFRQAIAALGRRREQVVVCAQFGARTAAEAQVELSSLLKALATDYIDVLTLYYVEREEEWNELRASGGALGFCQAAKRDGVVRRIGVTSHQRPLAAEMAKSGEIDLLMIRYNAAHRGAERDVFPVTAELAMPVIAYTATRWGALLKPTPSDPPGFQVPRAPAWYRFALQPPAVSVVLCAPENRHQLDEDLAVLAAGPLSPLEHEQLAAHGDRVRRHAPSFP
jgi:predicted aldo/keto reductase-like oxidoreductase